MKNLRFLILLFVFGAPFFFLHAAEQKSEESIELESVEGELFVDFNTGVATATNGVVVRYGGATLTAKKVQVNQTTGEAHAEGDVRILRDGQLWTGDQVTYNFKTRAISSEQFKVNYSPFFVAGENLRTDELTHTYSGTNALVTTDDYAKPGYHVRAKHVTMVPGEYIQANNATVYVGSVPVFYFPWYKRSLKHDPNHFSFVPGYRSKWGPFLLGRYNWYWNEQLDGVLHFDYREKRGFGEGADVNYDFAQFGHGAFKYYYTHDERPGEASNGDSLPSNRQRVYFTHFITLRTNLTVTTVARYQSDSDIIKDFFESEYHQDQQPSSYMEINQLGPNYDLSALTQVRLNNFQQTVERLPDIQLSTFRKQLGVSPLYYESVSSFGYFQQQFPDPSGTNYSAFRADTFHQILLPWNFFGWLNVTPMVGGRVTYYSAATGGGSTTSEEERGVFSTGVEVTTKASRVYRGAESKLLDVHGLRHIVQPSVTYMYVPTPNDQPDHLPQFDQQLASYRLLPIEFPDYNSIDSINRENVLRFALRNKFQTKRENGSENLINSALYTDWNLNPLTDQSTFADVYSDLDFKPRTWLTFNSALQYRIQDGDFSLAGHSLTIHPQTDWSLTLGHYYRKADPAFDVGTNTDSGNNLFVSSLYYHLNENWSARIGYHFDARVGTLQQQSYTLYRDLRSWTAGMTLRIRNPTDSSSDVTFAVVLSLKAFPRFKGGDDVNKPAMLLGG